MDDPRTVKSRERLVSHMQDLETLQHLKALAAERLKEGFDRAAPRRTDRPEDTT